MIIIWCSINLNKQKIISWHVNSKCLWIRIENIMFCVAFPNEFTINKQWKYFFHVYSSYSPIFIVTEQILLGAQIFFLSVFWIFIPNKIWVVEYLVLLPRDKKKTISNYLLQEKLWLGLREILLSHINWWIMLSLL